MLKKVFLILSFCFITTKFFAQQELYIERIGIEQGLSQSFVSCIIQDNKGFLWIGTQDGLNRYDGYRFKIFRPDRDNPNSLATTIITSLSVDQNDFIWIGNNTGVISKYDPYNERFINYVSNLNIETAFAGNFTNTIFVDGKNQVWISSNLCLMRYNRKSDNFTRFRYNTDTLPMRQIFSIYIDNENTVYLGANNGFYIFDEDMKLIKKFENDSRNPNSLLNNFVLEIIQDKNNLFWLRTGNGISAFDAKTETFTNYQNDPNDSYSLSSNACNSIYCDRSNNIWVGTTTAGINKAIRDGERVRFIRYSKNINDLHTLNSDIVNVAYEDKNGILWIGTGKGLNKHDSNRKLFRHVFQIPNNPNSINSDMVYCFTEDKRNNLWIGTVVGGVNVFNRSTRTFKHFLPNFIVRSIFIDNEDQVWVGTQGNGIWVLDLNGNVKENLNNGVNVQQTFNSIRIAQTNKIIADDENNIWISNMGTGVYCWNTKTKLLSNFRASNEPNSLVGNLIRDIVEDSKQNIWFCAQGSGVSLLTKANRQNGIFTSFFLNPNDTNSLGNNAPFSVLEDHEGNIWFALYDGGINKFNPATGKFTRFTKKNGLPNNVCYGILEDDFHKLWISTNEGLSRFDPKSLQFRTFTVSDGLQSNEFNAGSFYKSKTGELFFGGVNGYTSFYPQDVEESNLIPDVVLTDFQLFNKDVEISPNSILKQSITYTDEIKLTWREYIFSFEFAALLFSAPEKNLYAYKMDGFDKDWVNCGSRRYVTYINMPAGEYTFRVKASNPDGKWNEKGVSVKVTITPPFWKTKLFYAIIIFLIISFTYIYIKYRERSLIRAKQILEQLVKERTLEINMQKEEIQAQAEYLAETNIELEKLSIVASETDNGVVIMDAEGNFEWANAGFTRLYGLTLDNLISQFGKNIVDASSNRNLKVLLHQCITTKKTISYETQFGKTENKRIWTQTTITPILDESGMIKKLVAIDSDITKSKEVEMKIRDSILYARRIQTAILPPDEFLNQVLPDHFILYKPKDIVSGDFYWFKELKLQNATYYIVVAADCTGHGVPGAFMSLLGVAFLNEIVNRYIETSKSKLLKANDILNKLRYEIKTSLRQTGKDGEQKDGMDIALCIIDIENRRLQYAAAYNPLYIIQQPRNSDDDIKFLHMKGDKMPIGIYVKEKVSFTNYETNFVAGDTIYLFSDGYIDQFGGKDGRKFLSKNFRDLILSIHAKPMCEQKQILDHTIEEWKGTRDQVDDILVMGIRL